MQASSSCGNTLERKVKIILFGVSDIDAYLQKTS